MYHALGFIKSKQTKPDYLVMPKQSSKRSNLSKFAVFNEKLSEAKNLKAMGIPKIYDAGKLKWTKTF
jgi:hypothetical protein